MLQHDNDRIRAEARRVCRNPGEAARIVREIGHLRAAGVAPRDIGVIAPYAAQVQFLRTLLSSEGDDDLEIDTVDAFQGREKEAILVSLVRSNETGELGFTADERRLNVAITGAKHEVIVFSGLRAEQIDLTRTQARGVRDLKYFLDYAERGPKTLAAATTAFGDAEPDSEFERLVADRIREAGYVVHHQIGCSGYRIDLGVVDPRTPGRYLLGVECDGATYHRAATARDRDKLRQQILDGLGWKLCRIASF